MSNYKCVECGTEKDLKDVVIQEDISSICALCLSKELKIRKKIAEEIMHAAEKMSRYDEYDAFDMEIMEYAASVARKGVDDDE